MCTKAAEVNVKICYGDIVSPGSFGFNELWLANNFAPRDPDQKIRVATGKEGSAQALIKVILASKHPCHPNPCPKISRIRSE